MSDTLQTVPWRLGDDGRLRGYLWLDHPTRPLREVLGSAIDRLGIEWEVGSAFPPTEPLWYGLWIESPLNATQCALLRDLLAEVAREMPNDRQSVDEFVPALEASLETGEPLYVGLAPPGHVDFGWVTTFVHCPRCKAEGPVERWQESYPEDPIECPVCGHSYSPAATHSMERELFAENVRCQSCQAVYPVRDFSDEAIEVLEEQSTLRALGEELVWLRRVEGFYRRHPDLEGRLKPHPFRLLESQDPDVLEALCAGVPFGEIALPADDWESHEGSGEWSDEDRQVIDYLRHHHFSLPGRKAFVEEAIPRLESQIGERAAVMCPACGGRLAAEKDQGNGEG